jgi:hypothetical protein
MKLTSEQITHFQESGYVYFCEILSPEELEEAREAYHRVFESKPCSYRDIVLEDSAVGQQKAVLQQVLNVYELEDIFDAWSSGPMWSMPCNPCSALRRADFSATRPYSSPRNMGAGYCGTRTMSIGS